MSFDKLHPVVAHNIVNALQWPALRPLQEEAIDPLLGGKDALLLAPTAGGKTEAAIFPLLTSMATERWKGLSVLYVCPIKALLNNLHPRLEAYAAWTGFRCGLWHGDVSATAKAKMREEPPSILLTTPESLESILVSTKTDAREFFANIRTVVVDEIHAFAGDDRGWHLLKVLERISRLSNHDVQRVGLSATVGNPEEILSWFQGSYRGRTAEVISPAAESIAAPTDITLDFVGGENPTSNAAKVIASLHRGEKRLVFCESRLEVEELALRLRELGVTTFLSHSSLSVDERRQAEQAFAESRDCVIVATSTLELGIDVGDLDRMIQIDSPRTVASFLQRLGRTGRRPGSIRNALFLTKTTETLLQAAALLRLWDRGYVEPIESPSQPLHIEAQQLLALCLQEGRVGANTWAEWFGESGMPAHLRERSDWLLKQGFLDEDQGMLFIGPNAEARYGKRNFMELLAVFTAPNEFAVLAGGKEIGHVNAQTFSTSTEGQPLTFVLAGRRWKVTGVEWKKRRCHVEASDVAKKTKWQGGGLGISYEIAQSERMVLLGEEANDVRVSKRAKQALGELRSELSHTVHVSGTVVVQSVEGKAEWWTWAGPRAEVTVAATLPQVIAENQKFGNGGLRLHDHCGYSDLHNALNLFRQMADHSFTDPDINEAMLNGLKFNELLPGSLATRILALRTKDPSGAEALVRQPVYVHLSSE